MRNPKGHVRYFGPGNVTTKEYDTIQCVHCDGHWIVESGSGRRRGWCFNCGGPHCGQKDCWTCKPFEKVLEEAWQKAKLAKTLGLQT